ncbi:hypothetical protein COEREDRAFT_80127 [Coemansia reversa NRRL 1564]|uniref:Uncharacterized protein n=1 Tax=Coemansia reversa (strain ATCC 12441 / NRRL 1564) TaxID=763665 RepID=A0A2G5BGW3_COERN|nr:hypothetical protein COEREDRAFT_80127 [Coemansia reversa NRRL 1564]|eukprot:PIA18231.1 hypothetical protein COEREDRAFT_80127 [Coemansia reversa NRRL 1564]
MLLHDIVLVFVRCLNMWMNKLSFSGCDWEQHLKDSSIEVSASWVVAVANSFLAFTTTATHVL